ncbi:preprotein translocase subunit SecG [Jannaschia sp. Os4]|uniref:preprotein translocase subunit SecG n=1 Tax=Jannaschia sp. Os4 TaxID=2807617 RepID=UPI00193A152B|nr:preprotein translocase subunit SecG [Jannaschia sp. Os4]MBM2574816.1 preprotein translocase subunit SecG [Jannaschia sp. Os4]
MENVILVVHLILAVCLIGIVLLQRSEGGGLGIGGGGGAATGRPAANPMTKVTWALAIAFIATSITLTIVAAADGAGSSVVDLVPEGEAGGDALLPPVPSGDSLLPPSAGDGPLVPPTPSE